MPTICLRDGPSSELASGAAAVAVADYVAGITTGSSGGEWKNEIKGFGATGWAACGQALISEMRPPREASSNLFVGDTVALTAQVF